MGDIHQRRAKQRRYILREKGADKMLFYIVSLTFVIHVALSMHVAVQHAEPFENGLEMDRAIDPKGYRLNIVVFYDDSFANQFKGDAATKEVKKLVAQAKTAYSHKSLSVKIQLDTMAIHHSKGRKWDGENADGYLDQCGEEAKKFRIKDANSYLCLAGKSKIDGHQLGGVAKGGSICDKNIAMRVLLVGYAKFGGPMGLEFTPQQASLETGNVIAHELGHNLGMSHDFDGPTTNFKKNPSGKGVCMGYMDYTESKDEKWSECSNQDLRKFLNKLKPNCLKPIGTTGASTNWSEPPMPDMPAPAAGDCKPPLCVIF